MDSAPLDHLNCRKRAEGEGLPDGFSLLEMMMVVTLILMVVSIAQPIYHTAMVRARETVLADDLWTLRYLLDRFTVDLGALSQAPRGTRGERLFDETSHRPHHRLERDLAGSAGKGAALADASVLGHRRHTQRLGGNLARRHSI